METQNTQSEEQSNVDIFGFGNTFDFLNQTEEKKEDSTTEKEVEPEVKSEVENTEDENQEKTDKTVIELGNKKKETQTQEQKPAKEKEEPDFFSSIMQTLAEENLVDFDEEQEYEASLEGVKELIENTKKNSVNNYKNSLGKEASKLLDFLESGGTIEQFYSKQDSVDYAKVPLFNQKGDPIEDNMELLVYHLMNEEGYSEEEIEEKISDYKEAGLLEKESKRAQQRLVKIQQVKEEKHAEKLKQEHELKIKSQEEEAKRFREKVVNLKEIKGWDLTKKQAENLYDYVSKPIDKEGNTAFSKELNEDSQLLLAYLMMNKIDKSKLTSEVATKQVIKLKQKLSETNDNSASKFKSTRSQPKSDDFSDINSFNFQLFK